MKVYSPADVATQLNVKESTLRKYSLLLEEAGMTFQRNSQNQRWYNDNDVIALRKLVTMKNNGDMTLKGCADAVYLWSKGNDVAEPLTVTHNDIERHTSDISELKEIIQRQNGLIEALTKRIDQQQEYIKESLERRDKDLLQAIRESQQARLETAADQEKQEPPQQQEKRGFFQRLFGK